MRHLHGSVAGFSSWSTSTTSRPARAGSGLHRHVFCADSLLPRRSGNGWLASGMMVPRPALGVVNPPARASDRETPCQASSYVDDILALGTTGICGDGVAKDLRARRSRLDDERARTLPRQALVLEPPSLASNAVHPDGFQIHPVEVMRSTIQSWSTGVSSSGVRVGSPK